MAEDNLVNQIVAKKLLAQRGFDNIDLVSDGNQAVEAVRIAYNNKRPYDIVLMVPITTHFCSLFIGLTYAK
jgi:CheY-like chemotaxis protein